MAGTAMMRAWVIRPERLGDPEHAMQLEQIEVPEPGPGEVLVRVMAAGVNYNAVWASMGLPVSIFRYTGYDFHIAGSDASGIVERVGPGVTRWKAGDEVVIHCNQSCGECAECNGLDPMACTQQKIWAYESNWGSFAEYCKVQAQQLLPKPPQLTWEAAASYGLTYFTAYRMLIDQAGFNLDFDVRYLWMRQKRIIGSHFANAYQCHRANQLIIEGKIKPVLSRVFPFDECPAPHQLMKENQHVGKMVVLVGADAEGQGA